MANPLQMLKLKPTAIQFIHQVSINATPKKVWSSIQQPADWFYFGPHDAPRAKHAFKLQAAAPWTATNPDGSSAHLGTVSYFEPEKLLRIAGSIGLTHVPVSGVMIMELNPQSGGKTTLLRVGLRLFGFLDKDVKKRYSGGWKQLSSQLKALAES